MVGYQAHLADNIPAREAKGVENFSGMIPVKNSALLPDQNSAYCENAYLYGGTLRGFGQPAAAYTCKSKTTQSVYRIPLISSPKPDFSPAGSLWLEFDDPYMSVVKNPAIEDTFGRYFFFPSPECPASAAPFNAPFYNTLARLKAGLPPFLLGIPDPEAAPTVACAGGDASTVESRAYLYTWSTAYDEEGPPSAPTVVNGTPDGTWTIGVTPPTATDRLYRNITTVNLYRTLTDSSGNASYYRVASFPLSQKAFVDVIPDTIISSNLQLPSSTWTAPPSDLQGVVAMANGMLAGFSNTYEVWLCNPYTAWAWPAGNTDNVDAPIVGLAAMGSSLVICTEKGPWLATGTDPSVVTQSIIPSREPCIARGSILPAPEGVYYASPNGLILANALGTQNVSVSTISKENWLKTFPYGQQASRYNGAYLAFAVGNTVHNNGIILDHSDQNVGYSWLASSTLGLGANVDSVYYDMLSGDTFLVAGGVVYEWNPELETGWTQYVWRTKDWRFPFAEDFVGCKVYFDIPDTLAITTGKRNTSQTQNFDPTKQLLLLRVFADDKQVLVREVQEDGEQVLFPSGFKATYWGAQLEGQVEVRAIKFATSIKDLQLI